LIQMIVRIRGMEEYPADIAEMIRNELDFRQEAKNIETISANFATNPDIRFPIVVPEYSSQRVLTTEFVEGTKVTDIDGLKELGIHRSAVATRILRMCAQMIFIDGVFHADPHPGNIIVAPDGTVTMLDLGAVGRLAPGVKAGIRVFWQGLITQDPTLITGGLNQAGLISRDQNEADVAERAINYFQRRFFDQMHDASWSLKDVQVDMRTRVDALLDLQKLDISFRDLSRAFTVPKEWVLFERASILVLGLCTELDPGMNPISIVGPYMQEFVLGKEADSKSQMSTALRAMAMSAITIPDRFNRVLDRANQGSVQFQIGGLRDSALLVYAGVQQILFAMFAVGFAVLATIFKNGGNRSAAIVSAIAASLSFVAVLASMSRTRRLVRRLRDRSGR
ncbi:MAG TPA: AarF/ABC1/UbiB kinase family protein, partial [Gemmatimonadaceae bacterium]